MNPLAPAAATYRGELTNPDRWPAWVPRTGDVLVCTPPKCGTTWTQTMVSMLLRGEAALPGRLGDLSPWVDAELNDVKEMAAQLRAQTGRRAVKTHTPGDGFPVWDGVTVIAVYRHPLDVFFSLRKHLQNMVGREGHILSGPVSTALEAFVESEMDSEDIDRDSLATLVWHYRQTVLSERVPGRAVFHYAAMRANPRAAVARLAAAIGVEADTDLIDAIVAATSFAAMKAAAEDYVPQGSGRLWHDKAGFFESASSGKWKGVLSAGELARFNARLMKLLPLPDARRWLLSGA